MFNLTLLFSSELAWELEALSCGSSCCGLYNRFKKIQVEFSLDAVRMVGVQEAGEFPPLRKKKHPAFFFYIHIGVFPTF